MNKKGIITVIVAVLILTAIAIIAVIFFSGKDFVMQSGFSVDYPYTIEQGHMSGWNKLYLKDDHKTVYCFDDSRWIDILNAAKYNNQKVKVDYSEYILKGAFCGTPSGMDHVVVTNVTLYMEAK